MGSKSSGHGRSWEAATSLIVSMDCWLASPDCSHLIALEREGGTTHATTKYSNHVSGLCGLAGLRGGCQVGGKMNAPRVSDERLMYHLDLNLNHQMPHSVKFKNSFVIDLLQDLKDARDQLKTQAALRQMHNNPME